MDAPIAERVKRHATMLVTVIAVAVLALLGVAGAYFWTFEGAVANSQATWGQFGDYMGGVLNPIFGLGALFALLYTIVLQVQELHETRQEMRRSVDAANHQTFENTFFQLLRLHHQIVDGMKVLEDVRQMNPVRDNMLRGRESFERFCELLDDQFAVNSMYDSPGGSPERDRSRIKEAWDVFFGAHYTELVHYFRSIYAIIKFVDDRAPDEQHDQYIRLLQAQLSVYEFKLIFYNCLQPKTTQFKALIEKYALLQNVAISDEFTGLENPRGSQIRRNHYQFYARSAYGDWNPPPSSYEHHVRRDGDENDAEVPA